MDRWLLVGAGDVARRIQTHLQGKCRLLTLCRDLDNGNDWRNRGAVPIRGDLDQLASLKRLAGIADVVIHLAPPNTSSDDDHRTANLLNALQRARILPRTLIYISTTGVYGRCNHDWVDETSPLNPHTPRSQRRWAAERRVRAFGLRSGCRVIILRVPGIYAIDRLPLARLQRGDPVPAENPWTNHIHADDLARAILAAARLGRPQRIYNVVDRSNLRMNEFYDLVALHFGLKLPQRLPVAEIKSMIGEVAWSFMTESRRIRSLRLQQELRFSCYYPTVADFLASLT